jgi:muramoyltetrapeptide carboxypeptidase
MPTFVKPAALKKGDTIGVVVPAGPLNRERIDRAFARVQARGFRLKTYGDIYRSREYLAGDDATRAAEFIAAFEDPETTAVWCGRGGYGVMRILDRIDFDVVRRNPKVFVGFSDITALHIPFQERSGVVSFHGPNLQDGFGKPEDMPAANEAALWRVLGTESSGSTSSDYTYDMAAVEGVNLQTIRGGTATGPLTGGNLATLVGLLGTPYDFDTSGCVLFLEDVSERVYRIDRYLAQLRLAGKFDALAGVLLGTFSYDEGDAPDSQEKVGSLLSEVFSPLGVPVLAGFPAGHEKYNFTLPMGGEIKLDAHNQEVTLQEHCVAAN